MEEKKKISRKDRIKNIAIIFLVIMLILTFFSDTIMNYSLPQVATERVTSNTITAKVRGSGTVTASDPYNVVIEESRKIKSVAVKNGDMVEKDQILFELEDTESTELVEARKALEDLQDTYNKAIVSENSSSSLVSQVENGNTSSAKTVLAKIDSYNSQIDSLNNSINSYNKRIAEIDNRLSSIGEPSVDTSAEQKAVTKAEANLANAEAGVTAAEDKLSAAQNTLTAVYGAVKTAESEEAAAKKNMEDAKAVYEAALVRYAELKAAADAEETSAGEPAEIPAGTASAEPESTEAPSNEASAADSRQTAREELEAFETNTLNPAKENYEAAQTAYEAAAANTETVRNNNADAIADAQESVKSAQTEYDQAVSNRTAFEKALNNARSALENKQNSSPDTSERDKLTDERASLSLKVSETTQTLADVQEDLQDLLTSYGIQSELTSLLEDIAEQKKLIADLEAKTTGTVITAPVAGTVSGISCVAGETTMAGDVLAQVVSSEKGFTLSFSVTADQAKKISIGDVAEIQNSWYYSDVTAVVAGFKTDINDRQNKLVVFTVTGDVTNGQSLTLSVGSKSSNYDLVVPNSAIREDNNGKFVLIVESKSSPLGNRYVATRVDVEVIASDDNYSAVKGGLYGYEYVITTSTQPVEAGKYVRLAD